MFQKVFQGGPHVEVFVTSGRDPGGQCKFHGPASSIKKEFNKSVKSYVYHFEGDSTVTKLQLPKGDRQTLALVQPYCVFQMRIPSGANIAIDLCVSDAGGNRRRMLLSTSQREVSTSPLHARVPLADLPRDEWMNLCINLHSLVAGLFKGQSLKLLDSVVVGGSFQLRRIFTLKSQPPGSSVPAGDFGVESIPKCCMLNEAVTVVISHESVTSPASDMATSQPIAVSSRQPSAGERVQSGKTTHIAFGSRVEIPSHVLKGKPQMENVDSSIHSSLPGSRGSLHTATVPLSKEEGYPDNPLSSQHLQPRPPKVPPSRAVAVRLPKQRIKVVSSSGKKPTGNVGTKAEEQGNVLELRSSMQTATPQETSVSGTNPPAVQDKVHPPEYNADKYRGDQEESSHPVTPTPAMSTDDDTLDTSLLKGLSSYRHSTDSEISQTADTSTDQRGGVIFQYCSPPKQFSRTPSQNTSYDQSNISQDSLNLSHEGAVRTRQDNLDEDFVSVDSDIHPHHLMSRNTKGPVSPRRGASRGKRDASSGVDQGSTTAEKKGQEVSLMRLSQIYDWRQYQSGENPAEGPPQSIESRLTALMEGRQHTHTLSTEHSPRDNITSSEHPPGEYSTSDSAEQDNSLANTMTMTMTWDDKLRDFTTPMLDTLDLRERDILSPPVAASVAPVTSTGSNEVVEGWNNDSYSGETADSCNRSGETEDEVELMYDPTLECFYDPKTCKYYVLQ